MYISQGQGTLRSAPNFNPDEDAKVLRKAMKGLGEWFQKLLQQISINELNVPLYV